MDLLRNISLGSIQISFVRIPVQQNQDTKNKTAETECASHCEQQNQLRQQEKCSVLPQKCKYKGRQGPRKLFQSTYSSTPLLPMSPSYTSSRPQKNTIYFMLRKKHEAAHYLPHPDSSTSSYPQAKLIKLHFE